ncbi:AAA family ATPase [Paenarthrobacter sp. YJN-D]|uniref:AAA family ATPase n=1 Tax=Paenarthrobacter sp. YJN-D TaxID=2735317 RepID=UPI00187772BA|nr:AAA family ATPase [Paenarthrobacter sp. YJN-D]QOT20127.1 AAA family ATPase [Paenarthrobacter sp. YJN-D]
MDSIFVNGTVGVGKSTLADALSATEKVSHAVIDLDAIRRLSPAPSSDRFNHELELLNLQSLTDNYRVAGAQRFIIAGVIETEAEIARYVDALSSEGMFVCRLVARSDVLESRLRFRHRNDPEGLLWHLDRVEELSNILESADIEDLVLDSSDIPASELAKAVRRAAGWD